MIVTGAEKEFTSAGESIGGNLNILNLSKLRWDRPLLIDIGKKESHENHLKNDVYSIQWCLPMPT